MYKIKLYGLGGQGIVTAANILSHAISMYDHRYAKTVPAYGHERRGAPVFTDVMIDDSSILLNTFVYEPDFVIVFDPAVVKHGVKIDQGIHKNSVLVVNTEDRNTFSKFSREYEFKKIYWVNATKIALETSGRNIPNGAMLGAIARMGIVKIDSIKKSIKEFLRDEIGEKNARAAQKAYECTHTT